MSLIPANAYPVWHFGLGLVVSYVLALPIGPVNVAVIQLVLKKGFASARSFSLGSATAETVYALLAVVGLKVLVGSAEGESQVYFWIRLLSIPLLLAMAFSTFRRMGEEPANTTENSETIPESIRRFRLQGFSLGFLLNGLNPALLPLWMGVCAFLQAKGLLHKAFSTSVYFVLGTALGTFLLHQTVALLAARFQSALNRKFRQRVDVVLALFFLGFGLFSAWELYVHW
jgi:threonine/homoserine/homoserine lactone efflux protein